MLSPLCRLALVALFLLVILLATTAFAEPPGTIPGELAVNSDPDSFAVTLDTPRSNSFAVTDVRVFDGRRVLPRATVVVRRGRIVAVGRDLEVPHGLPVIDGRGMTLLPGFIDSHGHSRDRRELERSAQFGVTTFMDMWTLPEYAARMRREEERGRATDRADFESAISPATVPEGYPYFFTPDVVEEPTLSTPAEADAFVAARVAEGANHLKIMMEDMEPLVLPFPIPALDRETVRALTRAANRHWILAVAHVTQKEHAEVAVEEGIDGLVHVPVDQPIGREMARAIARRGIFVVPTLNAEEGLITEAGGATLVTDPDLAPYLTEDEIAILLTPPPPTNLTLDHLEIAKANVRELRAAGAVLLAGTDVATQGVSFHRDLELLNQAGLTPKEVLVAATAAAADAWGLPDRGRIAPGLRADLVLVAGDPTADIKATRAIRRVWKAGVEVERPLPSLFSTADRSALAPHALACAHGHGGH